MTTPSPDPGPRPGTRPHREYPDLPGPVPAGVGEQSSTWRVRHDDGSFTTVESNGSPLADPALQAVLHALFVEPEPDAAPRVEREESLLHITWRSSGVPAGTAELFADGRLTVDCGTGSHVDRRLSADQLRAARETLGVAVPLRSLRD